MILFRSFCILLFFITSHSLIAQKSYIVTRSQDTLYGEVIILNTNIKSIDKILFKTDQDKKQYNALQIINFSLEGEKYETVKLFDNYHYMKLKTQGYLSLFYKRPEGYSEFSAPVFSKLNGENMEVPNIGYKKAVSNYLSECSDISKRVKNGEFKKKDILQLVEAFNACMKDKTIAAFDPQLQARLNEFQTLIDKFTKKSKLSNSVSHEETMEIMNEIKSKKENNEEIPSFLSKAFLSSVKDSEELSEMAKQIIDWKNQ